MSATAAARPHRIRYKCRISLFQAEWDDLEAEAHARGITGDELIGSVLSSYVRYRRDHAPVPEPDDEPEDAAE